MVAFGACCGCLVLWIWSESERVGLDLISFPRVPMTHEHNNDYIPPGPCYKIRILWFTPVSGTGVLKCFSSHTVHDSATPPPCARSLCAYARGLRVMQSMRRARAEGRVQPHSETPPPRAACSVLSFEYKKGLRHGHSKRNKV